MQIELAWYLDGPWAIVAASGALLSESSALRVGDLLCRVTARYPLVALDLSRATHASRPVAAVIRTVHRQARGRGCVFVVIVPDPQAWAALRAADRDRELVLCRSGQEFATWRGRPRRVLPYYPFRVQMTEAFASALTVSIPIFALAAGAEARSVRDRLRSPDARWEKEFAAYSEDHQLSAESVGSAAEFFKGMPGLSRLYVVERIIAVIGAVIWLIVFVLLGIAEMLSLIWLADGEPRGNGGLATFGVFTVGAALLALMVAPAAYLLMPVLMPLDAVPEGLKKKVRLVYGNEKGQHLMRQVLAELDGAVDRATAKLDAEEPPPPPPA